LFSFINTNPGRRSLKQITLPPTWGLALLGQDIEIFIISNMAAFVRAGQTPVNICSYLVHQQRISFGSGRTFSKSPNNAKPCPLAVSLNDSLSMTITITISDRRDIQLDNIIDLYRANKLSSADKPNELYKALTNSHSLFSAWDDDKLVGIGNAISGGHLVVYYPHLLVHPNYQGKGVRQMIVEKM
jgi:hypothetical protein